GRSPAAGSVRQPAAGQGGAVSFHDGDGGESTGVRRSDPGGFCRRQDPLRERDRRVGFRWTAARPRPVGTGTRGVSTARRLLGGRQLTGHAGGGGLDRPSPLVGGGGGGAGPAPPPPPHH